MKLKSKTVTLCLLLAVLAAGITGCSTSKNTFPNRAYHNVTCRYNVLWNGKQSMKQAEEELSKLSKDNYTATLPVYNYPSKSDLAPALAHLDRTIEKASKSIYKHSMLIRGKEYVKTIDDAYLLMGQAYFHKQDYVQAQRVSSYILHNYPKSNTYNDAAILQARTSMRQGYFASADEQLENLHYLSTNKKNKRFKLLFNAAKAEYHLTAPDGDRQEAIDYLNNAIAACPDREFKARLNLIVGELYEELGQQAEAQNCFNKVIKSSSTYEMVFCAQMHIARNYDGTEESRNAIMKRFGKMLEESKNEDFKDQIFYACSEIARIDEDDSLRKDYLAKSVAAYTNNAYQRTFSSITLADLYFEEDEYRKAQDYYDTATLSIPKNYPDYDGVKKKATVLKDLVLKLDEIDLQDSLQRIAKMPEAQRRTWVQKMIADYTEAERKAAAEEAERMLALQNAASYTNINTTSSNGKWYFYNQSLVTAGQQDFYRRWGNRKLEDNWFVSNKEMLAFEDLDLLNNPDAAADTLEYDEDGNPIPKRETDPKKEAYYLQDLPLTQQALDSSNALISKYLFEVGYIYRDLLENLPKACESFESLYKRFPDGEYTQPCAYLLYVLYTELKNPKAETYKQLILTKYPDTDYAKLINDPKYYEKLKAREMEFENRYAEVYDDFILKRWADVVRKSEPVIPLCSDTTLKAKYSYLCAVAAGQVYNEDTLVCRLNRIVNDFPNEDVATLARIHLSALSPGPAAAPVAEKAGNAAVSADAPGAAASQKTATHSFVLEKDKPHYLILLVKTSNLSIQTVKQNLNAFNKSFFSLQRFNITSFYINNTQQMVTVSKFANSETAMDYYDILVKNENFSADIANGNIEPFAISATNYTTFYNKTEERNMYNDFFKKNYLEGRN